MANQAIQCCMDDFRIKDISEVTTETEPISNITVLIHIGIRKIVS